MPRESIDLDIRTGGHWRLTMVNADNPAMRIDIDATVLEAVPAERFVIQRIAQGYHDMPDGTRLALVVTLQADGDGTLLHLTDGPYSEFMRDNNSAGWLQELARLDEVLEPPPTRRALRLVD